MFPIWNLDGESQILIKLNQLLRIVHYLQKSGFFHKKLLKVFQDEAKCYKEKSYWIFWTFFKLDVQIESVSPKGKRFSMRFLAKVLKEIIQSIVFY